MPGAATSAAGASEAQSTPAPTGSLPWKPLPAAVVNACTLYSGGDKDEEAENLSRATRAWRAGAEPMEIVAQIRAGAGAVFV